MSFGTDSGTMSRKPSKGGTNARHLAIHQALLPTPHDAQRKGEVSEEDTEVPRNHPQPLSPRVF